ncbi:lanC-like protein 3 -like [Asbolus verrucosus]|uniref:LanC-like protein 3 homolog n=1 Tax=Asbolus verrucosus TaxID=1661398 RepID=A0A482W0C1_ASBVE|nr:lanC-like protein 3 -like [Asbolus verrucosus]
MAPARYFPNTMPDYEGQETDTQIPQGFLSKFVEKIVEDIEKSLRPMDKNGGDGLYLGTAGVSYMYYHLSKIPAMSEHKHRFLTKSVEYLAPALNAIKNSSQRDISSFILGNAGVYAVAAAIYQAIGDKIQSDNFKKMYREAGSICKDMQFLSCGSDELFVGRAGYVLGALWLSKETNTELPKGDIYALCNTMVESGRKYAHRHRCPCPLMYSYYQVEYLGAAHGLCTILQALLTVPGYLDANPVHAREVKTTIDYLLSLQDSGGNFPCASDEIGARSELVHWCHGAGGMIYLMAKAYLVWNEPKYLKSCEKMAELIWAKGLLKKGPGICHGVAGNGYAFLLLYRLTGKPKHLYRGIAFAKFMQTDEFVKGARTPDYPFSLYEGIAGTACFLGDLMCPQQAVFPFSDVF